jgi:CCR4-NOT complex subunit CAF16
VQLVMGLINPWELLLLDEVTVDLDVLVRADFLDFLKEETESRGATIIYATHIFDGKKTKYAWNHLMNELMFCI